MKITTKDDRMQEVVAWFLESHYDTALNYDKIKNLDLNKLDSKILEELGFAKYHWYRYCIGCGKQFDVIIELESENVDGEEVNICFTCVNKAKKLMKEYKSK